MKMTFKVLAGTVIASLLVTASAHAEPPVGLYFRVDAGGNWTEQADLEEFFGVQSPNSKVEFNAGPRFGMACGYDVLEWLGFEGQIGWFENEISSVTDGSVDARLWSFPFMVNARIHMPTWYRVAPYIGAGVGGNSTTLDIDHFSVNGSTPVEGTTWDTEFAWQAFAGVRFMITQHMGLSFEYRFIETDGPRFHEDVGFVVGSTDTIKFGNIRTHSVTAAFDWTF